MGFKSKVKKHGVKGVSKKHFAEAFAGIVEAGFLMAAADGEYSYEEEAALAGAIQGMIEDASESEIIAIINAAWKSLEKDGWDVRMDKVARRLADSDKDDGFWNVVKVIVFVAMSDEWVTEEENELYYQIAESLGYDSEQADEAWNEVYEMFE